MSKKLLITLISVAGALLLIGIVILSCALYANGVKKETETPDAFYSQWMSNIESTTLIKNIAIPGTHDSGTYTMSYVARTQDLTIYEQLQLGVRYLDLRVEKAKDGKLYIYHGSVRGVLLETVLTDISRFINTYKTEALILDFQHFKGSEDVQQATHDMLVTKLNTSANMVNNYVSDKTDVEYINNLSMATARGKCVVFWGSDSSELLSKTYIFKRNDDQGNRAFSTLHSFYESSYHKGSSNKLVTKGLPQYIERYAAIDSGLFVLQGQLTDGLYIFGPRFRERQHQENMNEFTKSLNTSEYLDDINIIMRDFINGEKVSLIIELNIAKNVVKKSNIETFKQGLSQFLPDIVTAE